MHDYDHDYESNPFSLPFQLNATLLCRMHNRIVDSWIREEKKPVLQKTKKGNRKQEKNKTKTMESIALFDAVLPEKNK